jgi:menaquinone-dependent protoporphyrinogen oxidase
MPAPTRVLVAYASRAGSTAEAAEVIGQTLREHGCAVDVRSVKDVPSVAEYDALVLGSAVWVGKPLPEAVKFLESSKAALGRRAVAYFVLCDVLKDDTPKNRERARSFTQTLAAIKAPVATGYFAGARSFAGLNPLLTLLLKHIVRLKEGDWRDWNAIRAWAGGLYVHLTTAGQHASSAA